MKKKLLVFLLSMISISVYSQTSINGVITDHAKKPLNGWTVTNRNTLASSITDANGKFTMMVNLDDILEFSKDLLIGNAYQIDNADIAAGSISASLIIINPRTAGTSLTSKSYWVGATIGYNLAGKSSEDIVGSAKVIINPMKDKLLKGEAGIIGNFANFQNAQDSSAKENIKKITQSTQGLFIGLSNIWTLSKTDSKNAIRMQFTTGARLNAFSKVGIDSSNVDLIQFRNSLGIEFEGLEFSNGGVLNFSTEISCSFFDKSNYYKVFNENKSSLLTIESSVVLPISKNVGILFNSTITPKTHPVYMIGVIFKGDKSK